MNVQVAPTIESSIPAKEKVCCPLILQEGLGIKRVNEPVSVGIPFPAGMIIDSTGLVLLDPSGKCIPVQVQTLSHWPDGSLQWGLIDFFANAEPGEEVEYRVEYGSAHRQGPLASTISIEQDSESLMINTGKAWFYLNARTFKFFDQVLIEDIPFLVRGASSVVLSGENGERYEPRISSVEVETHGPIRLTLCILGKFFYDSSPFVDFIARMTFYAESDLVELRFTLRNSRASQHPGGLWDLGDPGSIYFSDLSVHLNVEDNEPIRTMWNVKPLTPFHHCENGRVQVYQDSSGGANWKSANHINRFGKVMHTFPGYRVAIDGTIVEEGKRATPIVSLESEKKYIVGTVERFWQNFPKALEVDNRGMSFRLFPDSYQDVYELQGGEQKTHTIYIQFSKKDGMAQGFDWIHERLGLRCTPEWYAQSKAVSYLIPRSQDENSDYVRLIDSIVDGDNSFFDRREIIDEYGWRHFGELYSDHESVGNQDGVPRISHYNNQYDVVYGAFIEYLRTGNYRWFSLMQDLARHVVDIDIYHTQEDRQVYNGGMFWHTDHYVDAATATHRTYSKMNQPPKTEYGGGPSNEQNYTSGLLHYYFLTADPLAREAVQGLADWVLNLDKGVGNVIGRIDTRSRGLASATVNRDYHGPGRGAGNSINALLDGYRLTLDRIYITKAEELVRRCIHPRDCIAEKNFSDVENRWSYTIFLQVLGKYLDFKVAYNELDEMYAYAKASLLHYAEWMNEHEVPYTQVFDCVKSPTETWPAQDIRKSNVFKFAAKYTDCSHRDLFLAKADFFFRSSILDLLSFNTCRLTRPLVLLLGNGYMHAYFQHHPGESAPPSPQTNDFGRPSSFKPQFNELYNLKEWAVTCLSYVRNWGSR